MSSSLLTMMAFSPLPPFIFALAIGIPSAILYAIQLFVILFGQKNNNAFQASFFKLFAVRAIWSLLGYVSGFFYMRFGRLGLFRPIYIQIPQIFLAFVYFFCASSFHVDNLATTMLLFNRLTALLCPMKYTKFWSHAIYWSIGLILLVPLPFTWHIFTLDLFVNIQSDGTFAVDCRERLEGFKDPFVLYLLYSNAIFTVVCLTLNLACFFAYRKHKNQQQPTNGSSSNSANQADGRMERKLAIYTICTFLAQLFLAIFLVLMFLNQFIPMDPEMDELVFLSLFNQLWVGDLCTIVVPAWLLLWASDPMRKRLAQLLPKFINRNSATLDQHGEGGMNNGPKIAWSQ